MYLIIFVTNKLYHYIMDNILIDDKK